jgi:hypothetical protein
MQGSEVFNFVYILKKKTTLKWKINRQQTLTFLECQSQSS